MGEVKMEKNNEEEQKTYMLNKAFFGKSTAFKLNYDDETGNLFFRIGKKGDDEKWKWEIAKMNDMECGQILNFLDGFEKECNFFHKFEKESNVTETKINFNKKEKDIFISINSNSKSLVPGEQRVFKILLEKLIWKMNKNK